MEVRGQKKKTFVFFNLDCFLRGYLVRLWTLLWTTCGMRED